MIPDPVEMLHDGVIGMFQPLVDPPFKKWFTGHMQLGPEGATIAVVASKKRDPSGSWADDPEANRIVAGITEAGTVLVAVDRSRRSTTRGERTARVVRWHATTVLIDMPLDEVDGDTVASTKLDYLGLDSWSGVSDHVDEPIVRDSAGVVGWRLEIEERPQRSVAVDDTFGLWVQHGWSLKGPRDSRTLQRPLTVGIRSQERRPLHEHVTRLDALHALLSVAHKKPVVAAGGSASLAPASRERAILWDSNMTDAAVQPDSNDFPVFTLADINDVAGVAAWIKVCLDKPRAVTPIVRHRLVENQTPEARLLYTASALEYWVASNARNKAAPWAHKIDKFHVPHAISLSVSDEWKAWIGDHERWAELFSTVYNQLKHDPTAEVGTLTVDALEYSGRWLLTASILDQCAQTQQASASIFRRGLTQLVAHNVRDAIADASISGRERRR